MSFDAIDITYSVGNNQGIFRFERQKTQSDKKTKKQQKKKLSKKKTQKKKSQKKII